MASVRTTFTIDEELMERARQLGVNLSASARQGIAEAVRTALMRADREAYQRHPEHADPFWTEAEAWSDGGTG
jgi:post-segregation antitoxin (ccd killing protein)